MNKALSIVAVGVAALLTVTACSSSKSAGSGTTAAGSASGGSSSAASSAASSASGLSAPVSLKVTSLNLCNETAELAADNGIFTKHKLNVTLVPVKSGSAGIAALQGGSTDVAFVSPQALLTAIQQGVGMQIISDSGETTKASQGLIVKKGSSITGAADLKGKTVAVNDLGGTAVTLVKNWASAAGVDPTSLKFVALGFADIEPAVVNGKVDVGAVGAADVQRIKAAGGTSIGNPTFDGVGATPNALYAVSSSWLSSHEDVAKAFTAAMQEAADFALNPANNTAKFATWEKYCKTPAATLADTPEIAYTGYVNMSAMNNAVKQFKDANILKPEFDVTKYVPTWAQAHS